MYSGGDKTSVKTLKAYINHNKAKNTINLGANWKLLISSFKKWSWMLILTQYLLSYGIEKVQNLKFVWPKLGEKWLKPPINEGLYIWAFFLIEICRKTLILGPWWFAKSNGYVPFCLVSSEALHVLCENMCPRFSCHDCNMCRYLGWEYFYFQLETDTVWSPWWYFCPRYWPPAGSI